MIANTSRIFDFISSIAHMIFSKIFSNVVSKVSIVATRKRIS